MAIELPVLQLILFCLFSMIGGSVMGYVLGLRRVEFMADELKKQYREYLALRERQPDVAEAVKTMDVLYGTAQDNQ